MLRGLFCRARGHGCGLLLSEHTACSKRFQERTDFSTLSKTLSNCSPKVIHQQMALPGLPIPGKSSSIIAVSIFSIFFFHLIFKANTKGHHSPLSQPGKQCQGNSNTDGLFLLSSPAPRLLCSNCLTSFFSFSASFNLLW